MPVMQGYKPNNELCISAQSTHSTVLFLRSAIKGTCMDISNVVIDVVSDWMNHQTCGIYMLLTWLSLFCQLAALQATSSGK